MNKAVAIDPGISKCGIVVADIKNKKVCRAQVIQSKNLITVAEKIYKSENKPQFLIGNGTSSQKYVDDLGGLIPNLLIVEEKNSTFRAKQRYFEIFPLRGFKSFLPREIFILNKNLDALAALVIMEDYYKCEFKMSELISTKTWLK